MIRVTDSPPDIARPEVGTILVNRWYVGTPERQRAGADALVVAWERTPWPDGFLSVSCLLSTDGDTVVTYAQWTSDDAHQRMVDATPINDQAQWRNEITGTAGIRFTGYKRFHVHRTLMNA